MGANILCKLFICVTYSYVVAQDERIDLNGAEFEPLFKTAASEFSSHEVVHPVIYKNNKKIKSTLDQTGHSDDITLKFRTRDHDFVIPLKRNKHLFTRSYVEKSYIQDGKYTLRRPHRHKLARHCFYHGYIWGSPHSLVALSTCDGITGYISTGDVAFHIEPAFDLSNSSHRLYNDAHSLIKPAACGIDKHSTKPTLTELIDHKNLVIKRMKRAVREPYDADGNTRYVEMYIVNDYKTYDSNGRDLRRQNRNTQNIANIVSKLFKPFNIYIALVGIENWIDRDQFTISTDPNTTLENFLYYRRTRINPNHPNDNAQFITNIQFINGVVGKAIKGTICTNQYSGGVNLNLATVGQTAATIAHELGHNFGMDHDNYTICKCKDDKCIMAATSGGVNTPSHWSSCSMLALQEAFEMGMDYCLKNKPTVLFEGPVCGNGFTEDGEQCDCGLPEDCMNHCCNTTTCMLTAGSTCATGGCCDLGSCQPKPAASECRASIGECDLPEFCWGNSPDCPSDVYRQNGVECMGGQSYCYNGQCKTHTGQCKLLWGNTGRVSDPICFKHLNTNGSKHGNCGYNWTTNTFEPCRRDDVMCGLLHCVHQNEKLMFWKDNLAHATHATFLTIGTNTYVCRGAMLDVGLDMPDPGMVPDGAKCEERKMCLDHKCVPLSHMKFATCQGGCSDRGVCNSKGHCHCDKGFGPPECDVGGNGGSVDSGPVEMNDSKSLLIGLLVFCFVILPLIGFLCFVAYRFRADIQAWWNAKITRKNKAQSRPSRPSRPPPKRDFPVTQTDEPPPPYPGAVTNSHRQTNHNFNEIDKNSTKPICPKPPRPSPARNTGFAISAPVLTSSTHNDTKHHLHTSPVADHRKVNKTPPKLQDKPTNQSRVDARDSEVPLPKKSESEGIKSRFTPFFKVPSFSKGDKKDNPCANSAKPSTNKQEEMPVENIVKKRELNREISNPVLISTTDRRSKHYCQVDKLKVHQKPQEETQTLSPPVPPHISLMRSESDTARRNRPLPPRPLSMPDSECGDDIELQVTTGGRRSMAGPSASPRVPQRPPPPPVRPVGDLRQTLQDELSKIDDIQLDIPSDISHKSEPKTKPKPRTTLAKTSSDSAKKAIASSKPSVTKASPKPEYNSSKKANTDSIQKPLFNPKARPGLSQNQPRIARGNGGLKSSPKTSTGERKVSTESMEDDNSANASVSGLAKIFEAQKKPLLGDKKDVRRTQSHQEPKAPMTPPKPKQGAKQIRSVNV